MFSLNDWAQDITSQPKMVARAQAAYNIATCISYLALPTTAAKMITCITAAWWHLLGNILETRHPAWHPLLSSGMLKNGF